MDQNFLLLNLRMLIFDLIVAFTLAKLEIQIEGKHGWAENLPTWRIKNKWTKIFWGNQAYTGYHFLVFDQLNDFITSPTCHGPIFLDSFKRAINICPRLHWPHH